MAESEDRESIWQRIERPKQAPRVSLTHDQIAEAAVEIADADGIDAVSMRRLADRLGVATMGLYRYVRGKNDIIELMVDAVYRADSDTAADTATDVESQGEWRAVLRRAAYGQRALFARHPWLIQTGAPLTPSMVSRSDRLLAALDGMELDEDTKMALVSAMTSFVHGTAAALAERDALLAREDVAGMNELRAAYSSRMTWLLDSGRYPAFARYIRAGTRKDDTDWQFEVGLECLLEGIARRYGI
ncbi:TetR/AcrR family transcriptional regulator [Spongiactinospora sp. TRM90649]|uniref:TetR/AcrR family transcriptional regulator n=1 Tax=Spongiactinospora sp. TRM90649 TaxID=3031114 RepID=UPI0023F6D3E7|nr:TetR/AcrR family transcriptional regulator [Spongiactinospora sp. TRM90649]MDF5754076.1 TetR/AcrR family transcriptional regulator [Spongiactinospora sp. TRM90649]